MATGFPELIRRFAGEHLTDREIEEMDPIGSSPVFIHKEDLRRVAPIGHDVTLKIKRDKEADKAWGWVLEMYGYTIAAKIGTFTLISIIVSMIRQTDAVFCLQLGLNTICGPS